MTQLNTHVHELKKVTNLKEKRAGKKVTNLESVFICYFWTEVLSSSTCIWNRPSHSI